MMTWIILIIAGFLEVAWALGLKATGGFTFKSVTGVLTMVAAFASMALLSYCLSKLPVGTAYTVWVGIGVGGVSLFGILLFHEEASLIRIACLLMILIGVIGLKLSDGSI